MCAKGHHNLVCIDQERSQQKSYYYYSGHICRIRIRPLITLYISSLHWWKCLSGPSSHGSRCVPMVIAIYFVLIKNEANKKSYCYYSGHICRIRIHPLIPLDIQSIICGHICPPFAGLNTHFPRTYSWYSVYTICRICNPPTICGY